jgi:hypothetical protein
MGKIYSAPDGIEIPKLDFKNVKAYEEDCKRFEQELRDFCIKRNPSEHVGEIISFPVADGKAQYMVAALSPIELIHLPLWDGYEFEFAHRLTKKDIIERIKNQKSIEKFFGDKD